MTSIFFKLSVREESEKATIGDQNARAAPSVPASAYAASVSSERTQRRDSAISTHSYEGDPMAVGRNRKGSRR